METTMPAARLATAAASRKDPPAARARAMTARGAPFTIVRSMTRHDVARMLPKQPSMAVAS